MGTIGFGTDNLVFVPPGERLTITDIVSWSRVSLDVHHSMVRPRQRVIDRIVEAVEKAVGELSTAKRTKARASEFSLAGESILDSLGQFPQPRGNVSTSLEMAGTQQLTMWVRLTDAPAESYFVEDYEEHDEPAADSEAFPLYGSFHSAGLDDLEVAFPERDADAAFWLLVPMAGGVVGEPLPIDEPLPIVREFCGVDGVSSRGASINLGLDGTVAGEHRGCTPLRRVGEGLYLTLYWHLSSGAAGPLSASVPANRLAALEQVFERSRFVEIARGPAQGPTWLILRRGDDIVHLYLNIEGKESAGTMTMAPFLVVARAGDGSHAARVELLRQFAEILQLKT